MDSLSGHCRRIRRKLVLIGCLGLGFAGTARADYFSKDSFEGYAARGKYPIWSKTWVPLEPRVYSDANGLPFVEYSTGRIYNPVTIAVFGLLAYNRHLENNSAADRAQFLRAADWLRTHQDGDCGCWYYDLDYTYLALDEKLERHWVSGMAQGLALSVMTRAYWMTGDRSYLDAAKQAMSPLTVAVADGGVLQHFSPAGADFQGLEFFEEYPTRPAPSFTLNGFLFTVLGLYDLSQVPDQRAKALFESGMRTVRVALPFYDLGAGSAYDLVHLTRPPRAVHWDTGYHLVHITLLNALGSATRDPVLLWYRDHWNSYGTPLHVEAVWFEHLGIWVAKRHPFSAGFVLFLVFSLAVWTARSFRKSMPLRADSAQKNPRWGLAR